MAMASPGGALDHVPLELTNKAAELSRFDAALTELAQRHELAEGVTHAVRLCGHEVFANIISYAYEEAGERQIGLAFDVFPDRLVMWFEDDGIAYNPLDRGDPKTPASLQEAEIGGLGIMLVKDFTDGISYARVNDRNRLTMEFLRAQA